MFKIYSSKKGEGTKVYNNIDEAIKAAKEVACKYKGYTKIIRL